MRYIAREMMLYFAVCFLFFFMVFFVNQMLLMAENVLKKRVPLGRVLRLVVYCMPFVIAQSAPFAALVGFLMCASRMVSFNEITVMRASGISHLFLILPLVAMGLVISVASFFVNDYLLPLGTVKYNALYRKILMSNPQVVLESRSVKKINEATLIMGDVAKDRVSNIVVIDKDAGKTRIVAALDSTLASGKDSGVLMRLDMNDVSVIIIDKDDDFTFDEVFSKTASFNIFDTVFFSNPWVASPREMTSHDLWQKILAMEKDGSMPDRILNRYRAELHRKFSQPLGAFFFSLLALPLALLTGARGGKTAGMVAGVAISVLYWAMMITGQIAAGRLGMNAFCCMWSSNFAVLLAGIILIAVTSRK